MDLKRIFQFPVIMPASAMEVAGGIGFPARPDGLLRPENMTHPRRIS